MTIKEIIDVYSPSCAVRVATLRIIRQRGLQAAIRYLKTYSPDHDYSIFDGIDTKNSEETINVASLRDPER